MAPTISICSINMTRINIRVVNIINQTMWATTKNLFWIRQSVRIINANAVKPVQCQMTIFIIWVIYLANNTNVNNL